ncbi:FAD-dependent oxidoreductase [Marinococcus halophilus]|uniref:FAD-dependent oxidoreductase n=1 Tax=Marinococcus halophilus TaxID=1371 RepID=UPI003617C964
MEAEVVPLREFEKISSLRAACRSKKLPEEVKRRCCWPMKPVGLEHPETGERPHAVVQLRQDNQEGTLFNIVGFQTHLKWGPQKEVIRLIPGLENADIVRYGVMHRNTFWNSPNFLNPTYQTKARSDLFFAGQITGVEGYVESAASGLVAGWNAAKQYLHEETDTFPKETVIGAMSHYITTPGPRTFSR